MPAPRNLISYELHYPDWKVMKAKLERGPEEVPEVLTIPPMSQVFFTTELEPRVFQLGGTFHLIPGRQPRRQGCVAVYHPDDPGCARCSKRSGS